MSYGTFDALGTALFGTNSKKVYGKTPVVPALPTLQEAQKTAVASNQANFGDIAKTATSVNLFNQDQLNALIDRTLGPGVRQSIQSNIAAEARGEIPQDVQNAIFRSNAERTAGGNVFGGGGFGRNVNARDLGLTSLDITNRALTSAEQWLQQAKAPSFDVTSMFITPAQQNAANTDQFNRNWLAAKVAAAPDPSARGGFDTSMAIFGELLSAYGGGPGYQGTYKPSFDSSVGSASAGSSNGFYLPSNFGTVSQASGYGLAAASQGAGVANPYNAGGYNLGKAGGLAGLL